MGKASRIRRMVATSALAASVLAPTGLVVAQASPASATAASLTIGVRPAEPATLLLPAVQKVREAAGRATTYMTYEMENVLISS